MAAQSTPEPEKAALGYPARRFSSSGIPLVSKKANKTSPKDVAYMVGLQVGQQVGGRMFDMMSNAYLATILLKAWIKQISWQVLSQL